MRPEPGIVAQIQALEAKRIAALVNEDFAALQALMPADLTHIHSNGHKQNRAELIDRLKTVIGFLAIERGELDYRQYGDTVVAVGPMRVRTRMHESGQEAAAEAMVTQVWVKEKEGWQLVAFQSSKK